MFLELSQKRCISSDENWSISDKEPTAGRSLSSSRPFVGIPELFMSLIRLSVVNRRMISGSICRLLFGKEPDIKFEIIKKVTLN
jgi:hypothetical protein